MDALPERVFFSSLKEDRGKYFVEYRPPAPEMPFATLSVCCIEPMEVSEVADAMETELENWVRRYPVPVMVTGFDPTGSVVRTKSVRPTDHLIGWLNADSETVAKHWRLLTNKELPDSLGIAKLLT